MISARHINFTPTQSYNNWWWLFQNAAAYQFVDCENCTKETCQIQCSQLKGKCLVFIQKLRSIIQIKDYFTFLTHYLSFSSVQSSNCILMKASFHTQVSEFVPDCYMLVKISIRNKQILYLKHVFYLYLFPLTGTSSKDWQPVYLPLR